MGYVELQTLTAFSFQEGASLPEEIAHRAAEIGHAAVAIADRNTLSGVVRAHIAAKKLGLRFIVGARLDLANGESFLAYPENRFAYGQLCRLITIGRRRAGKGRCEIYPADLLEHAERLILIALPPTNLSSNFIQNLQDWRTALGNQVFLATSRLLGPLDTDKIKNLSDLAETARTPLVVTNDVIMHVPERLRLADILACVQNNCTINTLGRRALVNAERHLKPECEMLALFPDHEAAVSRSAEIADRCRFSLDELRYEYPDEPVPPGISTQAYLEQETWSGAHRRYPNGIPERVRAGLEYELKLTAELGIRKLQRATLGALLALLL